MARGRGRKRLSRMHAAIDAMAQFGFPAAKVRKNVSRLLKVYGGVDAWPFIEDCAYKELLDALLGDEEDEQENETENDDRGKPQDKCAKDETDARPSNATPDGHKDERLEENAPANPMSEEALTTATQPSITDLTISSYAEEETNAMQFITAPDGQQDETPEKNVPASPIGDETFPTAAQPSTLYLTTSPSAVSSPQPIHDTFSSAMHPPLRVSPPSDDTSPESAKGTKNGNSVPAQRQQFPCYGWIESDEEDPNDFISLKPMFGTLKSGKSSKKVSFDLDNPRVIWEHQ